MSRVVPALTAVILAASPAFADEGDGRADKGTLGAGIIIGEPTGVTAKLYIKDDQAFQAAAGFAFIGGGIHLHLDYVWHPLVLQSRDSFVAYIGPGARLIQYRDGRDASYIALGIRGVAGLLFDFKDNPLDAFVEAAGVLEYGFEEDEGFGPALNAAAGVRYYF